MDVRRTKIVATLGPATETYEKVRGLVGAGIDVARLNFSHGTHEMHRRTFEYVRAASEDTGRNVAVLQDIQGPKLRVGRFPGGQIELEPGSTVTVTTADTVGSEDVIPVDYPYITEDVEEGHRIVLADGLIVLEVTSVGPFGVTAVVRVGGTLSDRKGVACPDTRLRTPAVTEKDQEDLELGRELGVDYVAASFVRTGEDVREVRSLCGDAPVIAKIELAIAYDNLDEILAEADGIMVARGDLGVQLPLERIPIIQADILARTNAAGRISITATEMLESMVRSPRPTRAEASDVANAVFDGTDAVMLSGETATGRYPVEAVRTMARIIEVAESSRHLVHPPHPPTDEMSLGRVVAKAAVQAAEDVRAKALVVFSFTGASVQLVSKFRPDVPIIGLTPREATLGRITLLWGSAGDLVVEQDHTRDLIAAAEEFCLGRGYGQRGDAVVVVSGIPGGHGGTNRILLHRLGHAPGD